MSAFRRAAAVLLLVLATLGAPRSLLAVLPALATPDEREPMLPFRGASRDRTLPGKARVRARRAMA